MILQEVPEGKRVKLLRNREIVKVIKQKKTHVQVEGANGKWRIEGLYEKVDKAR